LVRQKKESNSLKFPPVPKLFNSNQILAFTGHVEADCDTIFAAIGAATLYGGVPARAKDDSIKKDVSFALKQSGLSLPLTTEDLITKGGDFAWGLVDHEAASLNPTNIDISKVVFIADHHLMEGVKDGMNKILYVDIKPWGSTCTILTWQFVFYGITIPPSVAKGLLCGIISDTINLEVNTTPYDTQAVDILRNAANMSLADVQTLAIGLISAGSDYTGMTPEQILQNDYKAVTIAGKTIGISSIKTVDASLFGVNNSNNLTTYITALDKKRKDSNLNMAFAGIIVVSATAPPSKIVLLYGSDDESAVLAKNPTIMTSIVNSNMVQTAFVSRKTDLVPAFIKALQNK
jgi:inorganic pyrophosphatase/exopolyphosphatase